MAGTLPAERSVQRMLTAGDLERILAGPEEVARLLEDVGGEVLEAAIREALRRELAALGRAALYDALTVVQAADLQLGRMVVEVSDYTRERVGIVVAEGIEAGASVNDIQKALQNDQGFSPMRALPIGRTQAARAQAAGLFERHLPAHLRREAVALAEAHIGGLRLLKGELVGECDVGVERGLLRADALQRRFGELDGGVLARTEGRSVFMSGAVEVDVRH